MVEIMEEVRKEASQKQGVGSFHLFGGCLVYSMKYPGLVYLLFGGCFD